MFKIIGELINTTRKKIGEAVAGKDAPFIQDLVKQQIEAGVHWIDVNAGARHGHEEADMVWLLDVVQEVSGDTPLCVDSNTPEIHAMAYEKINLKPLINSISLENDRWDGMAPFLKNKDCDILALCMDNTGLPKSLEDILERADRLVNGLSDLGFENEDIYIDPLVQPIATDIKKGKMVMDAIAEIVDRYPGIHTTCGASNISYGMPKRQLINRHFITMMISHGLDSAIVDPLDQKTMTAIMTADMLLGGDRFCRNFLNGVRAGIIVS
jgi:5-methyltetrahydrofolate--homocysteine methyltransferase